MKQQKQKKKRNNKLMADTLRRSEELINFVLAVMTLCIITLNDSERNVESLRVFTLVVSSMYNALCKTNSRGYERISRP